LRGRSILHGETRSLLAYRVRRRRRHSLDPALARGREMYLVPDNGVSAPTEYPPLFVAADTWSRTGRQRYVGLVRVDLLLLIAAIGAGVVAGLDPGLIRVASLASAAFLLGSVTAKYTNRYRHFDRSWSNGRTVAETLKAETWRYMMRLAPYDTGAADATFAQRLGEIRAQMPIIGRAFPWPAPDVGQVTGGMRAVRDEPLARRQARYLRERVADQIAWYASRAARHRRAAIVWFWSSLVLQCGAIVASLVRAFTPTFPSVWGLILVMGGAAAAWDQLGRNDEVSKAYGNAARELAQLRGPIQDAADEAAFGALVRDAEEVIAREQTRWAAKQG